MNYELIAFDMDGTLLDSKKQVLPSSVEAIAQATSVGKSVAICSGRCPIMVAHHHDDMPSVRYAICSSGATLYDMDEDRILSSHALAKELIALVRDLSASEDLSLDAFCGRGFYYPAQHYHTLDRYGVGIYESLFHETGMAVEDTWGTILDPAVSVEKIDLHFADRPSRDRVLERIEGLPFDLAYSESTTLEISPAGVNKGTGLTELATILGISVEATIGVGDSNNDLPMLRAAGLAVAMANGNENTRTLADVIVADNDHDGCAEAVHRFLLGGEEVEKSEARRS